MDPLWEGFISGGHAIITEIPCRSAEELWEVLSPSQCIWPGSNRVLFRGQENADWDLRPSFMRHIPGTPPGAAAPAVSGIEQFAAQLHSELRCLVRFVELCDACNLPIPNDSAGLRRRYFSRLDQPSIHELVSLQGHWPPESLFDLMALAQHHGMPTRLLDWSRNSYSAAFFAAYSFISHAENWQAVTQDLVVWAFNAEAVYQNPACYPHFEIVRVPPLFNSNLSAQSGEFTVLRQVVEGDAVTGHVCLREYVLEHDPHLLRKITIPSSFALEIIRLCGRHGINYATIYPHYASVVRALHDQALFERFEAGTKVHLKTRHKRSLLRARTGPPGDGPA